MADRAELELLRKQKRLQDLEARIKPAQTPIEKPPEEGAFRRFGRGMAERMTTNANKLANLELIPAQMLGYKIPENVSFSKESIRQQEQAADQSPAAKAGGLAGDVIMTAPLGALGRGMQAGESLPYVGRMLGNRTAQAAVEGGVAGAMTADPDNRMEDIRRGIMSGAILERGGRLLGRSLEGLVLTSPEAKAIQNVADLHGTKVNLPLATAASEEGVISPFAKFLYGKVLPALPGTSGTLQRQSQRAAAQLREIALKEAAPGGMGSTAAGYAAGLPMTTAKQAGAGSNVRMSMKDIQDAFDREYGNTIKAYAFNQPQTSEFLTQLQQKFPNIDNATLTSVGQRFDDLVSRYSKNGVLDGENLLRVKNELSQLGRQAKNDRVSDSYTAGQDFLDDVVKTELSQGNNFQNKVDLQRYLDLAEPWKNFQRVQRAAARSSNPEGQFTPGELMRAVKSMSSDAELARGTAPMQELATIGEKTVGVPVHQPTFLEKGMVYSALGGLGLVGSPVATAGLVVGGRTAASPAIQDVLMGTTNTQQALLKALRKRPTTTRMTGAGIRNTMSAEVADDE